MTLRLVALVLVAACSGCATAQLYDGPRRSADEVARISGDPLITAGLPMRLVLRAVDDIALNPGTTNTVEVLPGAHRLLVDCVLTETGSSGRHSIEVEVSGGRHYKLVAEAGPGLRECIQVTLQTVDF
jgi:hypothetical protein